MRRPPLTRKYRFMEMTTAQRRQGLEQKIPDISKTLDMVRLLKKRRVRRDPPADQDDPEPIETTFELADTLFARATLEPVEHVNLWLGVRRCC